MEDLTSSSFHSVKVNVSASDQLFSSTGFTASSRTIMSSEPSLSDFDFWIEGDNITSPSARISLQKIDDSKIHVSDNTNGYFIFSFEASYYRLTLYAVNKNISAADFSANIIMKASVGVDLRASDEINFYLSSYKVNGSGGYTLSIFPDGWTSSAALEIHAAIYSKTNGTKLRDSGTIGNFFDGNAKFSSTGNPASYNLEAGTYLLKLIISDRESGANYYYSDDLVIFANQLLVADLPIPNITVQKPAAPTWLIAGYKDSSADEEKYYVEFCWDDNSYNEDYFQLQLLDITDTCDWGSDYYENHNIETLITAFTGGIPDNISTMNTLWANLISYYGISGINPIVYNKNSRISDGSFGESSTYAVLKLEYGKNYLARIRAVNEAGYSDWAYLDIQNTGNKNFSANINGSAPLLWNANSSALGRYKIRYELNEGSFYDTSSNDPVNSSVIGSIFNLTEYKSQLRRSSTVNLTSPVGLSYSGGTASLKYKEGADYHSWTQWNKDREDGAAISSYNGYKSITVFAAFEDVTSTDATAFVPRVEGLDILDADIAVTAHADGAAQLIPFKSDTEDTGGTKLYLSEIGEVTVSLSAYRYLNFLLNMTHSGTTAVSFAVYEKGASPEEFTSGEQTNYSIPASTYKYIQLDLTAEDSENNNIYIAGKSYCVDYLITKNGLQYSYTATFNLTN